MNAVLKAPALVAVLLAVTAALATALVVVAQRDPDDVTIEPGSYLPPPAPLPTLTAAQEDRIVEIALADNRVKAIIGGRATNTNKPEVWTDTARNLMGGVVTLSLKEPITASGEWLGLETTDPDTGSEYRLIPYTMTFKNVSAVLVMVDLKKGEVVSIFPAPGVEPVGTPVIAPGVEPPRRSGD